MPSGSRVLSGRSSGSGRRALRTPPSRYPPQRYGRKKTHLGEGLAILGLTLAILSTALSAPAQTPGKIPHIGYIWIGAQKRQTSPSFSATLDCAASSASLLVRRGG